MELTPGAVATSCRIFSQQDFDRFAALSGDDNPIHVDPVFAARTRFGRTVCHGMLLYSTICAALTRELEAGFVQLEQELMFVSPTYTGEEVTVRLEVAAVQAGVADISTVITRPDGAVACQGRTLVALPEAGRRAAPGEDADGAVAPASAARHRGLALGQAAEIVRTFTEADLAEYTALTGDRNPAFRGPGGQAPGGLLGGLFSFLLGTRLPGRGTNWLKQRLAFPAACCAGQEITARVEIVRLRPDKDLVNLDTLCTAADGSIVCRGEALVLVKDLENA